MHDGLLPLLSRLPATNPLESNKELALSAFATFERELQVREPGLQYNVLLERAYKAFVLSLGLEEPEPEECKRFGASIPSWPAFPDTVAALKKLKGRYKLVILSNIDNASIQGTIAGPLEGVEFNAVYTAQEIGSYKPNPQNFSYLIEHVQVSAYSSALISSSGFLSAFKPASQLQFQHWGKLTFPFKKDLGIQKEEILHTANSLRCDHVPAKEMGLTSVWIDRGAGEEELRVFEEEVGFTWRFVTMGEMSEGVEAAFAEKGQ
jgi:FMN phosphatase YigB (HAD superfamily)